MIAGAPFDTAVSYRPGRQIVGRGGFDVLDIFYLQPFRQITTLFLCYFRFP